VCAILAASGVRPIEGDLDVEVVVFPPDGRRRDVDNVQKALLDALEHGGVYADDNQIVKLAIEKGPVVEGGKTVVKDSEPVDARAAALSGAGEGRGVRPPARPRRQPVRRDPHGRRQDAPDRLDLQ
jgi:hypothetical protein